MDSSSTPSFAPIPTVIADQIRAKILAGIYAAGERVNQDRVAAELGVSHIPVREALRSLESEGLVTFHPRRGFFVAALSAEDAQELGELRGALESLAVRLAVPRATAADLEAAEAQIALSERAESLAVWSEANWRFHRLLYAPCHRVRLLDTLEGLWRASDRYLRVVWQEAAWQGRSQEEHRAILAAFRVQDGRLAQRLVMAHVAAATRALVEIMA
jgi:DNA-binding GntR family transcriptional regulator